jgi:hypothetical protein
MGVTVTPLGFRKPDGNEPIRNGDNEIAANAQKAQDLIASAQATEAVLAGRIGVAEAKIDAGAGGPGLSADPDNAGLYFFAGPAFAPDPDNPGLFTF